MGLERPAALVSGFERLEDVVQDDRFVEADLRLRRSHHLGREDPDLYAFVLDALELLEHLYERFRARLVHRTDGYFFLVPIGDRLSRRQLTPGEMLVGQALALLYLDPATLRDNGVVDRSAVLRRLDGLLGIEALFRKLVPIRHARGAALPVADPQPPHETSDGSSPEAASTVGHELRLAIVMYGSVSLAIYMNGVAQELLNLVRATAGGGTDAGAAGIDDSGATKGTDAEAALAHVYREAAQHLWAARGETDAALPTRVAIDIVSGASAGGINGIFLAKALAAGTPMPALKDFWVAEADAAKLVAEDHSRTHLLADDPLPPSLFNVDRMFEKLLEAFASVRDQGSAPRASEHDLYV